VPVNKIKFSGGRSSAMMLMKLLENNQLNPKRGDVIIFNNTSAEHSATYEFTRQMKKIAEEKYSIPFFWIEYQTYEDSSGTYQWSRKPSYKLVVLPLF
jgi:predicted phosphoadenosine phosphosulfate sulfurtransferase